MSMSAAEAIRLAEASDIRLEVEGVDLILDYELDPPAAMVDALRRHKAEIVELLEAQAASAKAADDWRVFFDERAGIAEFDGGKTRAEAEVIAFEHCVIEWQNHNPEPSEPGRCAHCGDAEVTGTDLIPVLAGDAHTWLHGHCHRPWMAAQKERAITALAAMSIVSTRPTTGEK